MRRWCRNGPASWSRRCGAIRCSATSPRRRRRAACARSSTSIAPRAGQLGVSLQAITDTLNDAFAQRQISTIYGQANQYRVVLEALPMYQRDPSILSKLYCRARQQPAGAQVPLSAVATLTRTTAPLAISHQAQFPAVSLSFNLAPGEALGDAVEAVKTIETRDRHAQQHRRRLFRRRSGVRKSLAGQPWLILAAWSRSTSCWACSMRATSTRSRSSRRCPRRASAPSWR